MNNHAFYMDNMTKTFQSFLKTYKKEPDPELKEAFGEIVAKKAAANESLQEMGASVKDMTMEEYKRYIYDKISDLPMHPSNIQDSIAIQISDAGFEAMKNDPEYEKWILDMLKKNLMCSDPWSSTCGGKYVIFFIGASREECRAESWRKGYQNGNGESLFSKKSEDSFWERRAKRRKKLQEQYEEYIEQKTIAKRKAIHEYNEEVAAVKAENRKLAEEGERENPLPDGPAFYDANLLLSILTENLFKSQ